MLCYNFQGITHVIDVINDKNSQILDIGPDWIADDSFFLSVCSPEIMLNLDTGQFHDIQPVAYKPCWYITAASYGNDEVRT